MRRVGVQRQRVELDSGDVAQRGLIGMGQQHLGTAVLDHEGLALDRGVGVQRDVDRTATAHRQLTGQQIDATWQQQGHPVPGAHAQFQQVASQAIGVLGQLGIGPPALAMDHRHGLGGLRSAGLEQGMQRLIAWVVAGGGVEALQHLLAGLIRQAREVVQRALRRLLQGLDQLAQGTVQQRTHLPAIDLRHRLHGEGQALTEVIDVDHQRVVAALTRGQQLDA